MKDLNRWALGWSVVWTFLAAALVIQLALKSIPDKDTVLIAIDLAATVFVLIRLRKTLPMIRPASDTPKRPD